MSGEQIVVEGTVKVIEASGASIANNALVLASGGSYTVQTDGAGFPDATITLTATFAVAPTEGAVLALYARNLLVDGVNSADVPETTRAPRVVGYFPVNNVTTLQAFELIVYDMPRKAEYYLHNAATGQAVSAGWVMRIVPRTTKAAP